MVKQLLRQELQALGEGLLHNCFSKRMADGVQALGQARQ